MSTKVFARKASEQDDFPFVATYTFDTGITHHAVRSRAATAAIALATLKQSLTRFDCELIAAYDCWFASNRCRIYAKVKFRTLDGACRYAGLENSEGFDALDEKERFGHVMDLLKYEEAEQAKSHKFWLEKNPQDFVKYHGGKVEARIAQERKYFPMQVTVLYFLGHSANASSAMVARQLSTVGVKAKKIHGYYTDKHVNGEPNTLALIDVEFEDIQQAHKFFDEGLCWPESIMASKLSFADRLSYYWNNPVPDTEEELHEMTTEISSIVKQAVKIGAVRKIDSSATARVANEKAVVKPIVIPEFWCMNNGPNVTDPLGSLIKSELAWLKANGIIGATPVKAVARAAKGVAYAESRVMAVAFRLELTPKMMIKYCDKMNYDEDDVQAFWQEQRARHALTGTRYIANKMYPDLEMFDVKRQLGRWVLRRPAWDNDELDVSDIDSDGFGVNARTSAEMKDKPWTGTLYFRMPGYSVYELQRAIRRAGADAYNLLGKAYVPSLYIMSDREIVYIGFDLTLQPKTIEKINKRGFVSDLEDCDDLRTALDSMQTRVNEETKKKGYKVVRMDQKAVAVAAKHGLVVSRVSHEYNVEHAWRALIRDGALDWPMHVKIMFGGHPGDSKLNEFKRFDADAVIHRNDGGRTNKPFTSVSLKIDDDKSAFDLAHYRVGGGEIPLIDGSDESRWFAYRLIDNLGRNNFNLDSPIIEYAEFKSKPKPVSSGLMDRLRRLLRF